MKVIAKENYRIEVIPDDWHFRNEKDFKKKHQLALKECDNIKDLIKRHVDGFSDILVNYDNNPVCEFCGAEWTEGSPLYNGGCCNKDRENDGEFVWRKNNYPVYNANKDVDSYLTIPFQYDTLAS